MKCIEETGETGGIIRISGQLTIEHVRDFHAVLLKHIDQNNTAVIDLGQVDTIDLAGIQLICSAKMSCEKMGKSLFRQGGLDSAVTRMLENIGYKNDGECLGSPCENCFWKGDA